MASYSPCAASTIPGIPTTCTIGGAAPGGVASVATDNDLLVGLLLLPTLGSWESPPLTLKNSALTTAVTPPPFCHVAVGAFRNVRHPTPTHAAATSAHPNPTPSHNPPSPPLPVGAGVGAATHPPTRVVLFWVDQ